MAALKWAASNVLFTLLIIFVCETTTKVVSNRPSSSRDSDVTVEEIHDVLNAIDKLVQYFNDNVKTLNLDGFFGLRVLEGHLQLLIQEQKAGQHSTAPSSIWERIIGISKSAASVSENGKDFVRKDDSKYFEDFSQVVEKPWAVLKQPRKLDSSLRWEIPQYKAKLNVHLTEDLSDRCMKEVMNASRYSVCIITDKCEKIMTTRGLTGYGITHQLLWSILGEMSSSCDDPLQAIMKKHDMIDVNNMQLEMCTNNFYEMIAIVHVLMKGKVDESHQDLFMEQQFVCPSLGFYEFLKKDYLRQILSWQFSSGCFGEASQETEEDYTDSDQKTDLDVGHLLETYHKYANSKDDQSPQRDKFSAVVSHNEKEISDVHKLNNVLPNSINDHNRLPPHPQNNIAPGKSHGEINPDSKSFAFKTTQSSNADLDNHQPHLNNNFENAMRFNGIATPMANSNLKAGTVGKNQGAPNVVNFVVKANQTARPGNSPLKMGALPDKNEKTRANQHIKTGRRLLNEKALDGGCLSHKTGVGAGALVMYLHYLIKPGNINWTGQHELFLSDTRNLLQAGDKISPFQDMDSAVADNDRDEEEEIEEEADEELNDSEDIDDEDDDDDVDDEDEDGMTVNYNEDEGWEVPGDNLKGGQNDGDKDKPIGDIIINKDGKKRHVVDYANLDDQDIEEKVDLKLEEGERDEEEEEEVEEDEDEDEDEEEDHYYYDDESRSEKGIIRKRPPITPRPYPPSRVRRKHKNNGNVMYSQGDEEVIAVNTPNTSLLVLVSITPLFLIVLFLIKYFRRRKIRIR